MSNLPLDLKTVFSLEIPSLLSSWKYQKTSGLLMVLMSIELEHLPESGYISFTTLFFISSAFYKHRYAEIAQIVHINYA